jgi:succinate-semialdehyde dehydrogenase/glutarate-semialdehyde dehydrogenase
MSVIGDEAKQAVACERSATGFYAPTVLTGVPDDAGRMTVEPFGPLAPIRSFADLDEVIAIANNLPYGLAAYGFMRSSATANRLAHRLEGGHEGLDGYLITKRVSHEYV